jgi:hypothetical protein
VLGISERERDHSAPTCVYWMLSHRADPAALPMADRHYSRQKPGTPQFVAPGSCVVMITPDRTALWCTSWPLEAFTKHAWAGAWMNSFFRNEAHDDPFAPRASELIRDAVSVTRWFYGPPPALGMVTFINAAKVKRKRDPGRCYLRAGFKHVGQTGSGLLAFQLLPADMPPH